MFRKVGAKMSKRSRSKSSQQPKQQSSLVFPVTACVERVISTDKLISGLPYQRPVDDREVDRLVREWDEHLFEPLAVSCREGWYNVIDGQHRISAMRKLHGGREVMTRCKVYSGMTLFLKTYGEELSDNTFIKRMSSVDPDEITRRGKLDFSTNSAALRCAKVILEKVQQRTGWEKTALPLSCMTQ